MRAIVLRKDPAIEKRSQSTHGKRTSSAEERGLEPSPPNDFAALPARFRLIQVARPPHGNIPAAEESMMSPPLSIVD